MQPISFLPEEKITAAIQGLGESLSQINQARIKRQEKDIENIQQLLDVSFQGVMAANQEEVMKDWDGLADLSAKYAIQAQNENRPIAFKQQSELNRMKNDILLKVNYSKNLRERYLQAGVEAAKLKAQGKLTPESEQALINFVKPGTYKSINDMPDPLLLIESQYSGKEVLDIERKIIDDVMKYPEVTRKKLPSGEYREIKTVSPNKVGQLAEMYWDADPKIQKYYSKIGKQGWIDAMKAAQGTRFEEKDYPGRAERVTKEKELIPIEIGVDEWGWDTSSINIPWMGPLTFDDPQEPGVSITSVVTGKIGNISIRDGKAYQTVSGFYTHPTVPGIKQSITQEIPLGSSAIAKIKEKYQLEGFGEAMKEAGRQKPSVKPTGISKEQAKELSKKQANLQVELDKEFGKGKVSPSTKVVTPTGEKTIADLILNKGLTAGQIKWGIDNKTIRFK